MKLEFSGRIFQKKKSSSNFIKICPVGAEFCADRHEAIITFRNFANAPNKRQTSVPWVGFEPAMTTVERLQTCALDRTSAGIGN